ncbi:MAG: hypothetical protein R3C25_12950 [Hyphomonadaceae bacterium]
MRKILIACLIGFMAVNGIMLTEQALAQSQGGGQQGKQKQRPPPPPPRCADLGVGTYTFVTALPGQAPLAENEIALTYRVRNDGNAPYVAASAGEQSVALESVTPAGTTQLASTPAISAPDGGGALILGQGASQNGTLRVALPPEARGRPLRLRLVYSADGVHQRVNDCNMGNNTVMLARPTQ